MKLEKKTNHNKSFNFCLEKTEAFHTVIFGKTHDGMSLARNKVVYVQPRTGKLFSQKKEKCNDEK